ncbi:MAG TPA: ThiF family adenylyltransferase, partial [Hyphomicrobium sp.]|nr:ThiF family adenylyltransferase [Hyphomicrobium sp.]
MQDRTPTAPLSAQEIERYKRHLVLKEVGGQGQQALKRARVLLVGAGGLGSPLALYLAAAGVGTIGIADDDHVSLDNLQRQIAHATDQVGKAKVASAQDAVFRVNPHVTVEALEVRI